MDKQEEHPINWHLSQCFGGDQDPDAEPPEGGEKRMEQPGHEGKTILEGPYQPSWEEDNKGAASAPLDAARAATGSRFLWQAVPTVSLGGLVFGYSIGVVSGTLKALRESFSLAAFEEGLVVGLLAAGACIGAVIGGPFCDRYGRWATVQAHNLMFVIGSLTMTFAGSLGALCFGRLVVGIGSSLSSIADIPYLIEICPPAARGKVASSYELMVVLGILLSFLLHWWLGSEDESWRALFSLPASIAAVQSVLMLPLPESPRWLVATGHDDLARLVLLRMFGDHHSSVVQLRTFREERIASAHKQGTLSELYSWRHAFLLLGIILFFMFFTGGIVIRNYAARVFEEAGLSDGDSARFLVVLGTVKVLVTMVSIAMIDHVGRKPLLTVGTLLIGVGHCVLALRFSGTVGGAGFALLGCVLGIVGFSIGFGPVVWLLQGEMFPTEVRGTSLGMCQVWSNACMFVSNLIFVPLEQSWGNTTVFTVLALVCVVCVLFLVRFLEETKGRDPDVIRAGVQCRFGVAVTVPEGAGQVEIPGAHGADDEQ